MQAKLVDLFNTKYFYKSLVVDLNYLFGSIRRLNAGEDYSPNRSNPKLAEIYDAVLRKEEVVLDLAGARLTDDACRAIGAAQLNGIKFCDSENVDRNHLLVLNAERRAVEKSSWVPLPTFTYEQDIKEYIKNLDSATTYVVTGMSDTLTVALVCLITIIRPSVKLVIDNIVGALFKFIATKVPPYELFDDTSWYVYTEHGVDDVTEGDKVFIQELNKTIPIKEAVQYGVVVPKKFGRDVLTRNKNWSALLQSCLTIIEEFQETCPKKLSELYAE